jgi:RimJ/RimL family protein N-acetyltransferase
MRPGSAPIEPMASILPIEEQHIEGFRAAVDSVARERRYLARFEAPAEADVRKYVLENIARQVPHFVAIDDDIVVGWCDIALRPQAAFAHSGVLGIGVLSEHRGKGVGGALLNATLQAARAQDIRRVELTVRVDNERAKRLYEACGFVVEGVCRRHMLVDGEFHDSYLMAHLHA